MRTSVRALLLTLALATIPSAAASADPAVGADPTASGAYVAEVDFATLSAQPAANGTHCELTVQGVLTFSGTVTGAAEGTTTAYVLAPCEEVAQAPIGTYRDIFWFSGTFDGSVEGHPATGTLTYSGVTAVGGGISASIRLQGDSSAMLRADGVVAVGGTYEGVVLP